MNESAVQLKIADPQAAIRYMGEMQSRPMDPIHEPIQNLLDEDARRIDVDLDPRRHQIRIRGDAKPIASLAEAKRILSSICASKKVGKLGEKGVGMLSFLNVGDSMTTLSQKGGGVVWFSLNRENLAAGRVGRARGNRLPYSGTEIKIKGVSARNLKHRFGEDRVIRDIKRRWSSFLEKGLTITVNGRDVAQFTPPLEGDPYKRMIPCEELGKGASIEIDLILLHRPAESASVSVTHKGQANFQINEVPIFDGHNAFTQGMLHGTVTGDVVPINASRTGFQEGKPFDLWIDKILDLETELGKLIEQRARAAAEARDQTMLNEWMKHLKQVFQGTALASTSTSRGEGDEEGWSETLEAMAGEASSSGSGDSGRKVGDRAHKGGTGRLPTVPHAGFTQAPPNIRVVRERKSFKINVNHADFIAAAKSQRGRRQYIRELCLHEAFIFSLEGRPRQWYIDRSDEFMEYWTKAFVEAGQ